MDAIRRSKKLVRGLRQSMAIPFLGLLAARQAVRPLKVGLPYSLLTLDSQHIDDRCRTAKHRIPVQADHSHQEACVLDMQAVLLAAMPPRFFRDVPEIPISVLVLSSIAAVLLTCLMDVLPYAVYVTATKREKRKVV